MANIVLQISVGETTTNSARDLVAETGYKELAAAKLINYAKRITSGTTPATVRTEVGGTKASGTLIGTSVIATDAVVINGQTLTAVASGATTDQWNIGVSDTEAMANLATKINAHAAFTGIVTASANGTTVTITATRAGLLGNAVTLVSNDATIVASAGRLADGTDGTSDVTHFYGSAT